MRSIDGPKHARRWLGPPSPREQGAIWALALLGFIVLGVGLENRRESTPAAGFDCAQPRSMRLERGFTRVVACGVPPGGGHPLQGPARWLFGRRVSLGAADIRLLEALPRIGPARAQAIVDERGVAPFASIDALERVHGIGPATVEGLRPFLRVDPPSLLPPRPGPRPTPLSEAPRGPTLTPRSAKTDGEG